MAVKIRLSRTGRTNRPFFRIVAIDSRKKRDGEALEIVGAYDPVLSKVISFETDKVEAWVSKGAIVTDAVKKIQKMHKKAVSAS